MTPNKGSKIRFQFSEKANKSFFRGLRSLEPQCASKRIDLLLPKTIEKAYISIVKTQAQFIAQRDQIRCKLNTPSLYKEEVFSSESPKFSQKPLLTLSPPKKHLIHSIKTPRRSFTPKRIYHNKSPAMVSGLDSFIDSCVEIKEQSKNLSNKLPVIGKFLNKSFKRMSRAVTLMQDESANIVRYPFSMKSLENRRVKSLKF
ncbi:hypothetical protein SteCoe_34673 [Stentor coeruleus]|uniref:Uncharacterized protein n=1 Tax=Stentor coeruleus TaxID=5963 RepID=A0A1R2AU50_9CILI|nr:hypothetical protein SteCoe_34673 [Stentor coeruleus]